MEELRRSLNRSRDTAVGPDKIHYQFLKHLSESSLRVLLRAFNKIWQTGQIPSSWQEATIIPVPKPGKDHSNPTNYRPIALTSCICKTMERMVNDHLVWTLERERLISEYQCGFREAGQPSTTWSGLKLSFATPSSEGSMPSPSSSTSKKRTTRHGGTALCATCTTWVSEAVYPSSSPAFFRTDAFGFGSAMSFPTHTTRSWGCPRAASSPSPSLALRSTVLQTPSPEA